MNRFTLDYCILLFDIFVNLKTRIYDFKTCKHTHNNVLHPNLLFKSFEVECIFDSTFQLNKLCFGQSWATVL